MPGKLVVCATPIGNLADITQRVAGTLAEADLIACEDTRHSGKLLNHLGISRPTISLHEHNEEHRIGELLARIAAGETVALVSDAGMPIVSDPGARVVAAAREAGLAVEVLPGASAPVVALATSGLVAGGADGTSSHWRFVGFLPRKEPELLELLSGQPRDPAAPIDGAASYLTVAFESPHRILTSLDWIAAAWPQRRLAVCRELTKLHEQVLRGTAAEVAAELRSAIGAADGPNEVRGEITVVIEGIEVRGGSEGAAFGVASEAVSRLVEDGARAKTAAKVVAGLTGLSANELYRAQHDG